MRHLMAVGAIVEMMSQRKVVATMGILTSAENFPYKSIHISLLSTDDGLRKMDNSCTTDSPHRHKSELVKNYYPFYLEDKDFV